MTLIDYSHLQFLHIGKRCVDFSVYVSVDRPIGFSSYHSN